MIKLSYDADPQPYFYVFEQALFGPDFRDSISIRGSAEVMVEQRGIHGENDVDHHQIEADIDYNPLLGGTLFPTSIYPDRRTFQLRRVSNDTVVPVTTSYGLATHNGYSYGFCSTGTPSDQTVHHAFSRHEPDCLWRIWRVHKRMNSLVSIQLAYRFSILEVTNPTAANFSIKYKREIMLIPATGLPTATQWTFKASAEQVKAVFNGLPVSSTSILTTNPIRYRWDGEENFQSPAQLASRLDLLIGQLLPKGFPVEEVPYGDLAMVATEKVNANKVNMLEFLRDLRHPTQMIPKLSQLKSLKGIAGNYLSVKYGVLPTIDDIQTIINAFRRIAPYLDREGNTVYTARHTGTEYKDGMFFSLDQRIKVAIEDEDSMFDALIQRLESMGVLPTFESIWDLVNYSFIVDWLVDVGGFLERVDTRLRISRLNIVYATMSRRKVIQGMCPGTTEFPFTGYLEWVHYHRWVSGQCPVPPLSLKSPIVDFNHWLEATALLVQRAK